MDGTFDRDLFGSAITAEAPDRAIYPDAAGFKGEAETGREAAEAITHKLGRLQRMAEAAIREAGAHGLTADELAAELDMDRWSIQPRTSELKRKGLIRDSGKRRPNATGKQAIVWVAGAPPEPATGGAV